MNKNKPPIQFTKLTRGDMAMQMKEVKSYVKACNYFMKRLSNNTIISLDVIV